MRRHLLLILLCLLTLQSVAAQKSNPAARKFDEFGDTDLSDIAARLDNYAIALQNEPGTKAFLIVYRTRRDLPGLSSSLAGWMKRYLLGTRGFDPSRVVAVDGGVAGCLAQELWVVPPGTAPTPRSDAYQRNFELTEVPRLFYRGDYSAKDFEAASYDFEVNNSFEGFAKALRREPRTVGYLIAYAGHRIEDLSEYNDRNVLIKKSRRILTQPASSARNALAKYKTELAREYRVPPSRIRTVFGGYRPWPGIDLWLAPPDSRGPIPTPNQFPGKRK